MEIKEPIIKLRIENPLPRLAKILDFLKEKRAQNIETREAKDRRPSQIMEVKCLLPLSETV